MISSSWAARAFAATSDPTIAPAEVPATAGIIAALLQDADRAHQGDPLNTATFQNKISEHHTPVAGRSQHHTPHR